MKIGFYEPHLCLRGTTVAMFDYAYYNQTLLNNESIIFYEKNHKYNNSTTIEKFSIFKCIPIDSIIDLEKKIVQNKCDSIYIIKGGWRDERIVNSCKTLIQAVGCAPESEKHGSVYAYGSYWLSKHCSDGRIPAVPLMVNLPSVDDDMRQHLGIPADAVVFGRNGGTDTWNLPFADSVLRNILDYRKDIYFLFQNTPISFSHKNIIHLPPTSNLYFKTKFINTCDAMIHARREGESFGLSCAEFSKRNKPVITWRESPERNHIEILGNKGMFYSNEKQMFDIINNFEKQPDKDWNCYRHYNPENIMKIFKKVYIDE